MKNRLVAGGLALLTAFAIVACTTPNPSETGSSETSQQGDSSSHEGTSSEDSSSSSSSSSQPVGNWTSAQQAIMTTHLGGHVLPYMTISGATVTWYEDYQCVSIESASGTEANTTAYRQLLTTSGYTFEYDDTYDLWQGTITFDNFDQIIVQIYFDSGFFCDAYFQPAETSWPASTISGLLGETTNTVPAYQSSYYYVYDNSADSGYVIIVALNQVAASEEAYTNTLTAAGWSVFNQKYATTGLIARDPANQIEINFYFTNNTLEIYVFAAVGTYSTSWPSNEINTFLADSNSEAVIPSFTSSLFLSGKANFNDENNVAREWFYISIMGSDMTAANTEDVYKASLISNGFVIDDSKYATEGYYATSADEKIYINFVFDANNNQFMIYIIELNKLLGIKETTTWPAEDIATFVNNSAIVVPEATSDSYKTIVNDESVIVRVKELNIQNALTDYSIALTNAGWTIDTTGDHPIYINAGVDDSQIQITISTSQLNETAPTYLVITIEKYVAPLAAGVFSFADTAQLTSSSATTATWTSRTVTMTIDKNTGTLDVGGAGSAFLANPLRVYAGQKITFNSGSQTITKIEITCNGTTYATALAGGTWTGGTATASGTTVTVNVSGSINSVSVVLAAQTRLTAANVTIA